ncbi:MAG: 3-deoxy-D-manno-octulosonic acid transferase [Planctomycetales bacterium]|nr:3-deoxy-D-manno-octulosonic acid transferase [Planctomycetales bacterium]
MAYLLNFVYCLLLILALPKLLWGAIFAGKYREGFAAKFLGRVPQRRDEAPCIWLHAVSVGEVNLIGTLVQRIESTWDGWQIVISTTTKTGYDLACKRYARHTVMYCPLDFSWAVKTAMRRVRPNLFVLAELELWPNLLRYAGRLGAKTAVINGRLSERSFRGYRRIRWFLRPLLAQLDLVAAQNETYADRFLALGARRDAVTVTGSLKFDGAETQRDNPATLRLKRLAGFHDHDLIFLAGSTQAPEELVALSVFRRLAEQHANLRLVLVPRHPERFAEVASILDRSGVPWQRRSELSSPTGPTERKPILLVDAVGELGAWWGAAQVGFVGGSLSTRGGQNMIEPAAYGAAVSFGPNTWNFRDIVAIMLEAQAGVVVRDEAELLAFVGRCLDDPIYAAALGRRAQQLVRSQLGATTRTLERLAAIVDQPTQLQPSNRAA